MKTILQKKAFIISFLTGMLFFIAINFYYFNKMFWQPCFDCTKSFGIPFLLYESKGIWHIEQILWLGLLADVLVAVACSIVFGIGISFVKARVLKYPK
jgi:hypothetical protein